MVERAYGREILLEEAINDVVPAAFNEAVEELGRPYECIVYPQYDVVSSEKGQGLVFTATYDLKPPVTLGNYRGMELVRVSEAIEDGAVDQQLSAMQERFARLEKREGPAEMGDLCNIDFLGMIDGVAFEGGEGKGQALELGSNTFIPGFEDQLVGAIAGDSVVVNVTFPEGYQAEELSGKDAVFEVVVNEIQQKVLSEMNDEFASDVSDFETMEELRTDIEDKLVKEAQARAQSDFETKAVEKAMEGATVKISTGMIDLRQDQLVNNFARQITQQGLSMDLYLEYTNSDIETLRNNFLERAVKELKMELTLEAIADAEGISVSDEDVDAEHQRLAEQTGLPLEDIQGMYSGNNTMLESLKFSLMMDKTIRLLAEHAVAIEAPEVPDKPEAVEDAEAAEQAEAAKQAEDVEEAEAAEQAEAVEEAEAAEQAEAIEETEAAEQAEAVEETEAAEQDEEVE